MVRPAACLMLLVALASGCAGTGVSRIFHPGSAYAQQREAERFDPFPAADVGPEMWARPLAYIRPATLTERSQNEITFEERFGQPAPPGTYKLPKTPLYRQQIPYVPGAAPPAVGMIAPPPAGTVIPQGTPVVPLPPGTPAPPFTP